MYLQEILEVAIGLVFMWLVLSVAAMTIQEWIGNVLNERAKDLEQNIQEMLNSDDLTKQIYDHPLITSRQVCVSAVRHRNNSRHGSVTHQKSDRRNRRTIGRIPGRLGAA